MSDTDRCVREGVHVVTQRHPRVDCPVGSTAYDDVMPPGEFAQAVDQAVDDVNASYLRDYAANKETMDAQYEENAERWRMIEAAKDAGGRHAVVLPVATAREVVKALRGGDTGFFTPALLAKMIESNIPKVDE